MTAELTHPDLLWVFPRPRLKDADAPADDVRSDLAQAAMERARAHGLYAAPSGNDGIFVHTMRMVVKVASMRPALAPRRAIIVGDAERMVSQEGSDQAANASLKLLEEPPPGNWIVLTSSTPGALLPTIRSRVASVRVAPLTGAEVTGWMREPMVQDRLEEESLPPQLDDQLALAAGAPGRLLGSDDASAAFEVARRILQTAEAGDMERGARLALAQKGFGARGPFTELLEALESELRSRLRDAASTGDARRALGVSRAVESLEDAKALAYNNVNPQLIVWSVLETLQAALGRTRAR
jgi:DNA polymerase-3 subunit delta'